ncbi:MAG: DUF1460 domain-containing protein [Proteobacteria bacterium]|nr:DUF1460 domain-containing protein [Pseudomonadota bacterium]
MKFILPLLLVVIHSTSFAQMKGELLYGQSVEKTSEQFLGTAYAGGCLGEGQNGKFDQDPLCRFDQFDCQTYVETVLAMKRSKDQSSFEHEMNQVRYYKGLVDYATRLHFSETQWIPENEKRGYFQDITENFLPCNEQEISVDMKKWYRAKSLSDLKVAVPTEKLLQEWQTTADDMDADEMNFTYLRVQDIDQAILDAISNESIIIFVKKNTSSIGTSPVMVTHMGFVIDHPTGKKLRHATPLKDHKKVVDMDLAEYIEKFKKQSAAEKFPAVGIKILQTN